MASECRTLLDRVFAAAFVTESELGATLALLLPEDVVVDSARLSAVRDWCQGFLFGFGLAGQSITAELSSQTRELLNDFTEFTRLDTDDVDNNEANQAALIEIEEYIREGVMVIRDELNELRRSQRPSLT